MAEAFSAGVLPRDLQDMTYREVFAIFTGRNISMKRDYQLALFEAWHSAAFQRSKRLPPLADQLRKLDEPRVMSKETLRTAIMGIAKTLGATVRRVERIEHVSGDRSPSSRTVGEHRSIPERHGESRRLS